MYKSEYNYQSGAVFISRAVIVWPFVITMYHDLHVVLTGER